jgi:uncharacterized protein (DUF2252 family)
MEQTHVVESPRRRVAAPHRPPVPRPRRIVDQERLRAALQGPGLELLDSFAAPRLSLTERLAHGKALRQQIPRSAHAAHAPRDDAAAALTILARQNEARVRSLVPIRMARMNASAFGFLRGAAAVMAADLTPTPVTGLNVLACGDMHLLNFGLFASAERNLVFAINDFDEVHPGPWEWDLKRLAASCAVAAVFTGSDRDFAQEVAWHAVQAYARRIRGYAETGYLATWYDVIDADAILAATLPTRRRAVEQMMAKARSRGPLRALDQLTEEVGGEHQIVEDAPLIVRETHLPDGTPIARGMDDMLRAYLHSLPEDRRRLLRRYRIVDVARKVVGVGSVGAGCWVVLFQGVDSGDPLFLQIKEAQPSVLAPYVRTPIRVRNQGERVVLGQRTIQGSPDIFLGWGSIEERRQADFYVRQLADMKGGMHLAEGDGKARAMLPGYARLCGWALALAHAKSGDPALISGYCGGGDALPDAVSQYALAYLDQTERDHAALASAVRARRIKVASARDAGIVGQHGSRR